MRGGADTEGTCLPRWEQGCTEILLRGDRKLEGVFDGGGHGQISLAEAQKMKSRVSAVAMSEAAIDDETVQAGERI